MFVFPKGDRPAGWRKGPPKGGEIPAIFVMNGIEIFIDESGDFGPASEHCPYYVVTMVFHEELERLYDKMRDLEHRLEETGMLAKPESYFFGGEKNFRKNWIKSLQKNEWL